MGIITYDDADYLYEFCRSNGIKVRGHCIFWEAEEWQPAWVRSLDPFTLRFAVDNRLNSAVGHFKGKFEHWDVNNEMIHGNFSRAVWVSPSGLICSTGQEKLIRMQSIL